MIASNTFSSIKPTYLKKQSLPDLNLGYFQGTNQSLNQILIGYEFGLKIPIFYGANRASIESSRIESEKIISEKEQIDLGLKNKRQRLIDQYKKYQEFVRLFQNEGEALKEQIIQVSQEELINGRLTYSEFFQTIANATSMELEYFEVLNELNQNVLRMKYVEVVD